MVLFLFQMVFMDTAATIVTGAAAERWKFAALRDVSIAARRRSSTRCSATGRGAAAGSRSSAPTTSLGQRLLRLRRLGRRPCGRRDDGPGGRDDRRTADRQVQQGRHGESDAWSRHHDGAHRMLHPRLRMVRIQSRAAPSARRARETFASASSPSTPCWPARSARSASVLYMWIRFGKPDASMAGNGLLAGLVAITAPSGFVNTVGAPSSALSRASGMPHG